MILPNNSDVGQLEGPEPLERAKRVPITPETFFQALSVGFAGGVQGLVFSGAGGTPNDHFWHIRGGEYGPWAAAKVKGQKPAYMAMAAFKADAVSRFKGRTVENVLAVQGFWVDIEGSAEKFNKPGGENGCGGQVISDSLIGFFDVNSRSKALGDKLPSFECSLTLL